MILQKINLQPSLKSHHTKNAYIVRKSFHLWMEFGMYTFNKTNKYTRISKG